MLSRDELMREKKRRARGQALQCWQHYESFKMRLGIHSILSSSFGLDRMRSLKEAQALHHTCSLVSITT